MPVHVQTRFHPLVPFFPFAPGTWGGRWEDPFGRAIVSNRGFGTPQNKTLGLLGSSMQEQQRRKKQEKVDRTVSLPLCPDCRVGMACEPRDHVVHGYRLRESRYIPGQAVV